MVKTSMDSNTKNRYVNTSYEITYLNDIVKAILSLEESGLLTYEIEDALLGKFREIQEGIFDDFKFFCNH